MKHFPLFLFIFLFFSSSLVSFAEPSKSVIIESIAYNLEPDNRETITIKLSDHRVPTIFLMKGDKPRLVVDFPDSLYKGKNIISIADGSLAKAIRVGAHTSPVLKTRIVVDLSSEYEIKYEQVSAEQDKRLTIILSVADSGKPKKESGVVPVLAEQEKGSSETIIEKDLPRTAPGEALSLEPADEPDGSDEKDRKPQLLEISFDNSSNKGEMIVFHLNDFYPPEVSAIEKDTPRVLCDFMGMNLGAEVSKVIDADGEYVQRIRTTSQKNPDRVRVVLDLSPDRDYDLQQVFFKNDNLFVLIVNELLPEEVKE